MSKDIYCPMIHAGLSINLKKYESAPVFNQCCLNLDMMSMPIDGTSLWDSQQLIDIRKQNDANVWNKGCWECEQLEKAGMQSFRQSTIKKFGISKNVSGPKRIDLLFDRSCNLACVTCSPHSSTLWSKHLKDNNLPVKLYSQSTSLDKIYEILKSLDLSNLETVQFCGGETLLGNTYWKAAEFIAELVPHAKEKIELGFQTNGTQTIDEKYYKTIEKFRLVKLLFSIDGTDDRFEYLRWPASWAQVTDNMMSLREKLPVNVMFFVQEVTSCLNLLYYNEVPVWVKQNFNANRLGDPVEHATQLAMDDIYNVNYITQEYFDAIKDTSIKEALGANWTENPEAIKKIISRLELFDGIRNQNWKKTFPEVAEFYSRYI